MLLLRVMGMTSKHYGKGLNLFDSDLVWRLEGWIPLQVSSQQQFTAAANPYNSEFYAFHRDLSKPSTVTSS